MMEEGNGPFRPLQFVTSLPTDAVRTSPMGPSRSALTYANVTQNMHTNQGLGSFVHAPGGYYQQQQQQQANYMNALSTNSMSREESIWFTPKKAPLNSTCVICLSEVAPDQVMMVNDVLMHKNCVVCDICRTPLTSSAYLVNNQRVYCEEHYMKLRVLASKMQLQQDLGPQNQVPQAIPMDRSHDQLMDLAITVQPACFQIANYNVFPAPKVTLTQAVTKTCTVNVSLVECSSNLEMMDGFQAGNSKTLRIGGTCVHFAGLKFAKMGKIKGELRDQHVKKWESFCLRFTIGERTWDSQPFKLVSSCTQLPKDLRDAVRPPKRPHSILGSPSTSPLTLSSPSPSPSPSPTLDPSLASALFPLSSNAISYIFKEPAYPKNEL